MTGREAYAALSAKLSAAGLDSTNEANALFLAATGRDRFSLYETELSTSQLEALDTAAARRINGEPLQYICGRWPFLDFELKVDSRALIPRPETELLAQLCIDAFRGKEGLRIADLCSGTGALAIALKRAFPDAEVSAVELSPEACSLLEENARELGTALDVRCSDALDFLLSLGEGELDLVVCNPPYVTPADYSANLAELLFEPTMAFLGGEDGLDFYRSLSAPALRALKPGGMLAYEIGEEQGCAVKEILERLGFSCVTVHRDLAGLDRDVIGTKP